MLLKFKVNQQIITRLDNFQPVADSKNYLRCKFNFTKEWSPSNKYVIFNGQYVVSTNDDWCFVPSEVLKGSTSFSISIYQGNLITTNSLSIKVLPSGYVESLSEIPTILEMNTWGMYNHTAMPNAVYPIILKKEALTQYNIPSPSYINALTIYGLEEMYDAGMFFQPYWDNSQNINIVYNDLKLISSSASTNTALLTPGGTNESNRNNVYLPNIEKIAARIGAQKAAYLNLYIGNNISEIVADAFLGINKPIANIYFPFSKEEAPAGYPWGGTNVNFIWNYKE